MNTWKVNQEYRAPKKERDNSDIVYALVVVVISFLAFFNLLQLSESRQVFPQAQAEVLFMNHMMGGGEK